MFYKLKSVSPKSGKGTVSVVYRQADFETLKSAGVSVAPNDFDTKTGKVKARVPEHPELNAQIQEVTTRLETAVRNVRETHGFVTKALLDEAYQAAVDKQPTGKEKNWRDLVPKGEPTISIVTRVPSRPARINREETLAAKIAEYIRMNPEHRRAKTITGYQDLLERLNRYKPGILLSEVNLKFVQGFQAYLVGVPMRNGSVRTFLDRFKKLYTYLADEVDIPTGFLKKLVMVEELANDNVIYLTDEEVAAIEAVPLKLLRQCQVRAQFLFTCEVGLRHSDLYITPANVKENELQVVMKKSSRTVKPPLTSKARAILASEYFPFKRIGINQYNKTIRAICHKIPSFSQKVTITHFIGNNPQVEEHEKWAVISSHVGRKTAINRWLNRGVRETIAARWAGHKNTKMIEKFYQNYEAATASEAKKLE